MSYIDELFNRNAELWTQYGDNMKRDNFKQALTEALAKQRELVVNSFDDCMRDFISYAFDKYNLEDL